MIWIISIAKQIVNPSLAVCLKALQTPPTATLHLQELRPRVEELNSD